MAFAYSDDTLCSTQQLDKIQILELKAGEANNNKTLTEGVSAVARVKRLIPFTTMTSGGVPWNYIGQFAIVSELIHKRNLSNGQ